MKGEDKGSHHYNLDDISSDRGSWLLMHKLNHCWFREVYMGISIMSQKRRKLLSRSSKTGGWNYGL